VTDTPPLADEENLIGVAGEREILEEFLDYHRGALSGKLRGLSEEDARRRLVPSATTMLGLISHAAAVERNWFQHHLGGKPRGEITGNARGDAPSWDVAGQTIAGVIAEFDRACATSRQIAADFTLDQMVPRDHLGPVSLRWIYVHIIREHARHIGHADILREQIDGATGD
jgi:hypothetical protein